MAAKRLRTCSDDTDHDDPDKSDQKKLRTLPSFSTVIKEAIILKSVQNLFGYIEPLIRRVVQEEVERILLHSKVLFERSPKVEIKEVKSSSLRLVFCKPPCLPVFTGSKVEDSEDNPLRILLIDAHNGNNTFARNPVPLKLQVVVLNGEFQSEENDDWAAGEFEKNIVKQRNGKRPLLTGDLSLVLRDGAASIGELIFTDNSSWVRSQHFRVGVKVVQEDYKGPRVREAITEAFRVKDHRGELYKKHYPPSLTDEVWRLKKIGKDGAFHKRLSVEGVNTVSDFLKLLTVDRARLRTILGQGMSDGVWEMTIDHAKTCPIGERLYAHCRQHCLIFLNNICELVGVAINGDMVPFEELSRSQKAYVQEMVEEAYQNFDSLQEFDGMASDTFLRQSNQTVMQEGIEASSWHPGDEIQVEDFDELETTDAMIHQAHL